MNNIADFRRKLHKYPELSGLEKLTSARIKSMLMELQPDQIIENIAGFGIAAVFDSKIAGSTILFRADIDALPITESSDLIYKSVNTGVAHLCGHDGHTAILVNFARKLAAQRESIPGIVILLFQPAEEIGTGARDCLDDSRLKDYNINFSFALHNLPGFELGTVVVRNGTFASASRGMILKLQGKSSHAAHPEDGISPLDAMIKITIELQKISDKFRLQKNRGLITIVHIRLGDVSFGTSPSDGVIMATFRANRDQDLEVMGSLAENIILKILSKYKLLYDVDWVEKFSETYNDNNCVEIIRSAADKLNYKIEEKESPFLWSEDFGEYRKKSTLGMFGIGAGSDHTQLHNSDYDFPDQLIEFGSNMFEQILCEVINMYMF